MKTELEKRRLYKEAFAILERVGFLLESARIKHELSVAAKTKKAA